MVSVICFRQLRIKVVSLKTAKPELRLLRFLLFKLNICKRAIL